MSVRWDYVMNFLAAAQITITNQSVWIVCDFPKSQSSSSWSQNWYISIAAPDIKMLSQRINSLKI
jgi:hypothetical protein